MDYKKISDMYDYLSAESELKNADGAFVFGRFDRRVADKTLGLFDRNLVDYALVVGGIGKDSGALTRLNIPEAHYLASLILEGKPSVGDRLHIEPRPTNGGECCRMGIDYIVSNNLPHDKLTVVIHPTSLRRIMAMLENEAPKKGFEAIWQGIGTDYRFDKSSIVDQKEAVAEILRLADWPIKGWCAPQRDLPLDLVQVARDYDAMWKAQR